MSLYKIFVYSEAVVHESIIFIPPPPTCTAHTVAILLHAYCAIYDPPPLISLAYPVHNTILVMAIACKGHGGKG